MLIACNSAANNPLHPHLSHLPWKQPTNTFGHRLVVASTTSFGAQNAAKPALKGNFFAYFFKFHLPVPCLIAMECVGHPSELPEFPHPPRASLYGNVSSSMAHFKGFWDFAWANIGQKWLKIALNHLFEHPEWSRNNFGQNHFSPLLDPHVTPATLP